MGGGGGSSSRPQASPGRIPYRTKDFLMPEKTHGRSGRGCSGVHGLLELLRRLIAQCRMQTTSFLVLLDKLLDVRAQVIQIPILISVDLFSLERLHEALATGIGEGCQLHRMVTLPIPTSK